MFVLMITITVLYVGLVICVARKLIHNLELVEEGKLQRVQKVFEKYSRQKSELLQEKQEIENEAIEIFTLYEITKDITQTLSEEEAFEVFKNKLAEHVSFEECQFFEPLSQEIKSLNKSREYYTVTLQGKKSKIGFLAIKGISEEDKEKFMILAHQFALALRRVNLYKEIEKIAITDSLTEVHTRRYTLNRLNEEIKRSQMRKIKMSFLMVDVDHFKSYNDKYGHLTGDQILREIGKVIDENIREIDIAGRFGGEEFCVVLPDTDREGAQYAAERIRKATEETTISAYDTNVKVTLSIGISTYPDNGKEKNELIDKADWALYRAKKLGRNRVCSFGVYKE